MAAALGLVAAFAVSCSSSSEGPGEQAAAQPATAPLPLAEQANLRARFDGKNLEATNSLGMRFRLIPAGTIGAEVERLTTSGGSQGRPVYLTLAKPFYLGVHEVTQAQYERVTGENPSHFRGPDLPVDSVVWPEVLAFCRRLSELDGLAYRPPTEAEWLAACRAGGSVRSCKLDAASGWNEASSSRQTHPVGARKPNSWGFHDMHGNVAEWCQVVPEQYPASWYMARQGTPPARLSGGSWHANVACDDHRQPCRGNRLPSHGFRVAVSPP